ncbi:MAG: citrate/2-methylcitrate synthase [Parachlamydiaceae bacterium]
MIADTSSICLCDSHNQCLLYRGYTIQDMVHDARYEEIAWLLFRLHYLLI